MKKPILIVLHSESSTPGRLAPMLRKRGHAIDIRRPCLGEALPESLAEHGGPRSSAGR